MGGFGFSAPIGIPHSDALRNKVVKQEVVAEVVGKGSFARSFLHSIGETQKGGVRGSVIRNRKQRRWKDTYLQPTGYWLVCGRKINDTRVCLCWPPFLRTG